MTSSSAEKRHRLAPRIAAERPDPAAVRALQAEEHAQRRGLARAVGSEEPVHLTGAHGQIQTVQRDGPTEALAQPRHLDDVLHAFEATPVSQTCESC
jgi:hypothetical protein